MDELADGLVELGRVVVQLHVQVAELAEEELLALAVLEEEQGDEVLVGELEQFLGGEALVVRVLLLAEVVLQHELVHARVQAHHLEGLPGQVVLPFEDFE